MHEEQIACPPFLPRLPLPDHVYFPNGDDNETVCAYEAQIGFSDQPDRVYSLITFKVIDLFLTFNQPKR